MCDFIAMRFDTGVTEIPPPSLVSSNWVLKLGVTTNPKQTKASYCLVLSLANRVRCRVVPTHGYSSKPAPAEVAPDFESPMQTVSSSSSARSFFVIKDCGMFHLCCAIEPPTGITLRCGWSPHAFCNPTNACKRLALGRAIPKAICWNA